MDDQAGGTDSAVQRTSDALAEGARIAGEVAPEAVSIEEFTEETESDQGDGVRSAGEDGSSPVDAEHAADKARVAEICAKCGAASTRQDVEIAAQEALRCAHDLHYREDPEETPYRSAYLAREALEAAIAAVQRNLAAGDSNSAAAVDSFLEARLHARLGGNFVVTEEPGRGERSLHSARAFFEGRPREALAECPLEVLETFNQLGMLWSSREDFHAALSFLQKAESLFSLIERSADTWLSFDARDREALTRAYTQTMYYLAQVHQRNSNADTAAMYCHRTLKRQLDEHRARTAGAALTGASSIFDAHRWALDCVQLAGFYLGQGAYDLARHCLQACELVGRGAKPPPTDPFPEGSLEADINWTWGKMYMAMLQESRELYRAASAGYDVEHHNGAEIARRHFTSFFAGADTSWKFSPATSFDEAIHLYRDSRNRLDKAIQFYVLDGFVSNHIKISQDMSRLFVALAGFVNDPLVRCKLHRRRVKILQPITLTINPTAYDALFKELTYEIGEAYFEVHANKLESSKEYTDARLNKLALRSIYFFQRFIKAFEDPIKKETKFSNDDEDLHRVWWMAHFHCARLYGKIRSDIPAERIAHMRKSLDTYRWLRKYHDENGIKNIDAEIEVVDGMIEVLPGRLDMWGSAAKRGKPLPDV